MSRRYSDLLGAAEFLQELFGSSSARMAESRADRLSARGCTRASAVWRALARKLHEQAPESEIVDF